MEVKYPSERWWDRKIRSWCMRITNAEDTRWTAGKVILGAFLVLVIVAGAAFAVGRWIG